MKLTGQCKKDFQKWYVKYLLNDKEFNTNTMLVLLKFDELPDSMKYGAYLDFFDSVGIHTKISSVQNRGWYYIIFYNTYEDLFQSGDWSSTRKICRLHAIKTASEIYNENE